MSDATDWDGASYLHRSEYRYQVALGLDAHGPATPTQITEHTEADAAHVSRALQELRTEEYVELLVSEDTKKGRIYGLTTDGERALSGVEDLRANGAGGDQA